MRLTSHVATLILSLVLIGLIVPASVALHSIRSLALPIPTITATATILLPILTGATVQIARFNTQRFIRNPEAAMKLPSWSAISLVLLTIISETVIATLALTYMVPPRALDCHLDRQWTSLFSGKNAAVIRAIQDRHQCCGLHSVRDRAWPFPDGGHAATACHEVFGRQRSCFGAWRQDEQIASGLMFFVAVAAGLIQMLMIYQDHKRNTYRFASDQDVSRRGPQPRLGDTYHDRPSMDGLATASSPHRECDHDENGSGLVVQPSRFHDDGNEWRQN